MSTLLNLFITALIISISTATPICLSTNHNHLKSPQSDICIWDQFRQSERYADPSNFVCAFHVQHRIGRGSYGDVHLAKDWMTGTEVAYKFSTGSSKAARYLMHEVVVLEQLRSGLDAYPLASRGIVKNLNHTRLPTGKVIVVYELMSIDLAHLLARDIKAIDDVNKRHEHHVSPLGRRRVTAVIKQ